MNVLRATRPSLGDALAGFSVALVALPQAMAYAELAGLPAVHGLYAIVPALLLAAPLLSAKELQVGPVATTSLLTFGILSATLEPRSDAWIAHAALLALLVGLIRVAIGLFGWGPLAYLLSRPVRIGFLNAAALLIVASQLPAAVGVQASGLRVSDILAAVVRVGEWEPLNVAFAAFTVVAVTVSRRIDARVPGVLIAVVISILVARMVGYDGATVGPIGAALPAVNLALPWSATPSLLMGALVLALVGFGEAASIGRDFAAKARRPWQPGREFVSQGVANLAAGLFAGFPVGASFSRSALNRLLGATSRWSGFITGLVLLALLPLAGALETLPLATLAGIILAAAWSLVRPQELWDVARASRSQGVVAAGTFALTLALSPRIDEAVLIGVLLAAGQHLRRERNVRLDVTTVGTVVTVRVEGVLWYGSQELLEERLPGLLASHPDATDLVVDLGGCGRVDWSAAAGIAEALEDAEQAGVHTRLERVPAHAQRWFSSVWARWNDPPGPPANDPTSAG